jgi:hypothetical protein
MAPGESPETLELYSVGGNVGGVTSSSSYIVMSLADGKMVGEADGKIVGEADGIVVGEAVGSTDGKVVGEAVGSTDGKAVGEAVGFFFSDMLAGCFSKLVTSKLVS